LERNAFDGHTFPLFRPAPLFSSWQIHRPSPRHGPRRPDVPLDEKKSQDRPQLSGCWQSGHLSSCHRLFPASFLLVFFTSSWTFCIFPTNTKENKATRKLWGKVKIPSKPIGAWPSHFIACLGDLDLLLQQIHAVCRSSCSAPSDLKWTVKIWHCVILLKSVLWI